jgi:hypothetical protein
MITPSVRAMLDRIRPPTPPLPFHVDCPTLSREVLGDEAFEREFHRQRVWRNNNCAGHHDGEGIRTDGKLTGRRFKFELEDDAVLFRMFFG